MKLTSRSASFWTFLASPLGTAASAFAVFYILLICILRRVSFRDQGSWFFDPQAAYAPTYSTVRQQQAESYIAAASTSPPFRSSTNNDPTRPASLCVGVPSIARRGARYLRLTIGSLLEGLTQEERDGIHLIVFIPHTDPTVHPAYQEAWLGNLVDDLLLYNLSQSDLEHIQSLEAEKKGLFREKGLLDYTYLLKACQATGAPYIAILEDDVLALDGWYHRTLASLERAKVQTAARGEDGEKKPNDFLYLRMFYTEKFLGWNGEDWRGHTLWSICVIAVCGLLMYGIRSCSPPSFRRLVTPRVMFVICAVPVPMLIVLFFAAGKVTVFPLPPGVNEMSKYACCGQGMVYPQHKSLELVEWFQFQASSPSSPKGFVDMLTEQYADEHEELRWAMTPSVLQHIGQKSSKGDRGSPAQAGKVEAQNIWSLAFELNDPELLREEHAAASAGG